MDGMRIISADDHIDLCYLSPDLWTSRLSAQFRPDAPRVEQTPDGPAWFREGKRWSAWGSKKADNRIIVYDRGGLTEEPEPGVWRGASPKYRMLDMEDQGVYAQVMYNFLDWTFQNQDLKSVCCSAFNDWLAEEMCAYEPNRLIGLAVLPGHDARAAVAELQRAVRMGLRGVIFDYFGATVPFFDPSWDLLWSAAEEAGMAMHVHIGGGGHTIPKIPRGTRWHHPVAAAVLGMQFDEVLAVAIFSGVLDRHPKMKFVMAESGIGWIPYVLERLDYELAAFSDVLGGVGIKRSPREIFASQVLATFQDEKLGASMIPQIGIENVMWAADYPHGDGTFPHTKKVVARMFGDADATLRRHVLWENAARLYGIS